MTKKIFMLVILFAGINFMDYAFAEPRPMKARQAAFRLEFKVYRTEDMPANWFKTYDGFYVTRRIDNNWVYGQHTMDGMKMTDILVGSVDPSTMPELNEAYTYVPPGATPVYMPPLPPGMTLHEQTITVQIPNDTPQRVEAPVRLRTRNPYELAKTGTPDELRAAVNAGVNFKIERAFKDEINAEFGVGENPLHYAAAYNHNPESIKFLISLGLDINNDALAGAAGRYGGTPLFFAIKHENLEAIEILLNQGADLNIDGGVGIPINMFTAAVYNGYEVTDSSKRTSARQIIDMLIRAGGNINIHDEYSPNSEEAKQVHDDIAEYGVLSEASKSILASSRTALMKAVIDDDPDAVNILLDYNADPNIRDLVNKTALDYANELPANSAIKRSDVFNRLRAATKR